MNSQLLAFLVAVYAGAAFVPHLLSAAVPGIAPPVPVTSGQRSLTGSGDSWELSFTPDRRFVLFSSAAENLVPKDGNGKVDLFLRDRLAAGTALISVATNGAGANGDSHAGSVSDDGRWVAFQSTASDIAENDTNGVYDVFLRDTEMGETRLVSVNESGTGSGNGESLNPQTSRDGRYVIYVSRATDVAGPASGHLNSLYRFDRVSGSNELVSVFDDGSTAINVGSLEPNASADGRYVIFGTTNVLVRDLELQSNILVSVSTTGMPVGYLAQTSPSITPDGRFVLFESQADNLITNGHPAPRLYARDLAQNITLPVSPDLNPHSDSLYPLMTPDHKWVVYELAHQIYLADVASGENTLVSAAPDGSPANGICHSAEVSTNGQFVTFTSNAKNLVAGVTNGTFLVYQRDMSDGRYTLVTGDASQPDTLADAVSFSASEDGEWITFGSLDASLVPGDGNAAYDVFGWTRSDGSIELISGRDAVLPSLTPVGMSYLSWKPLSADGRYLVFSSVARELGPNDTNGVYDVFVRDLLRQTNIAVSVTVDGTATGNGESKEALISDDGRFVLFQSDAKDLVTNVYAGRGLFLRDLEKGDTTLVYSMANSSGNNNGVQFEADLSADGGGVVFAVNDASRTVYFFDRNSGTNQILGFLNSFRPARPRIGQSGTWISFGTLQYQTRADVVQVDYASTATGGFTEHHEFRGTLENAAGPVMSRDGRWLLFYDQPAYPRTDIYIHDLATQTNSLLCTNCDSASLSPDGRWVVAKDYNTPGEPGVLLIDRDQGTSQIVNLNESGDQTISGPTGSAWVTPDGHFVLFWSRAEDLVSEDGNGFGDVFLRDMAAGKTLLLSQGLGGRAGNLPSGNPVLSPDGETVAFESWASDLTQHDFNQQKDIFVVQLRGADSDGDGMDDNWEVLYFGDLFEDGSGDWDGDGMTDGDEYRAGTNPTDDRSILRAFLRVSVTTGAETVIWRAIPGKTYQVQFKEDLQESDWSDLPGDVAATEETASKPAGSAHDHLQRFYRVRLVE